MDIQIPSNCSQHLDAILIKKDEQCPDIGISN